MILDKHHIILYAVVIVFALGLTYVIESKIADKNQQKYDVLKAQSDLKDSQNIQFQQQMMEKVTQLADQNAQLKESNLQEQKLTASLIQQLQNQKKKDATLPPTDLGNRWAAILKLQPGKIVYKAPGAGVDPNVETFLVSPDAALATVQALEEPAALSQIIASRDKTIANDEATIANDAKILDAEKQSHASDLGAKIADLATANQQITTLKSEIRKTKLKWFGIGYVTGFTTAVILRIFIPTAPTPSPAAVIK